MLEKIRQHFRKNIAVYLVALFLIGRNFYDNYTITKNMMNVAYFIGGKVEDNYLSIENFYNKQGYKLTFISYDEDAIYASAEERIHFPFFGKTRDDKFRNDGTWLHSNAHISRKVADIFYEATKILSDSGPEPIYSPK